MVNLFGLAHHSPFFDDRNGHFVRIGGVHRRVEHVTDTRFEGVKAILTPTADLNRVRSGAFKIGTTVKDGTVIYGSPIGGVRPDEVGDHW